MGLNQTYIKRTVNGEEIMSLVEETIVPEPESTVLSIEELQSTVQILQEQLIQVQAQIDILTN